MTIRQQLHHLVDELDDERAPEALSYLQHLIDDDTKLDKNVPTRLPDRMSPLTVPGHSFFMTPASDLATLAAKQGALPVKNFDDLLGDFWPEDESVDDIIAAIRQWRREDGCA